MEIEQPVTLNEIGGRDNNEDSIYPAAPLAEDRLFMVCDGVGGAEKGEVASKLTCQYFSEELLPLLHLSNTKIDLETSLKNVEGKLKAYKEEHSDCQKMSTTLTLLRLDKKTALLGWVGDSRIYHIRDGKILFQTKDHSKVQYLIDIGEITEEEAQTHPERNIIERSLSGNRRTIIDHQIIKDIKANDFFLLCSDGILENLDKPKIASWFEKDASSKEIKQLIKKNAKGITRDNYSMIVIKINSIKRGLFGW